MRGSQLFAPSVLGLGEAETPITADKRLCYAMLCYAMLCYAMLCFTQIAFGNFFYPQYVIRHA